MTEPRLPRTIFCPLQIEGRTLEKQGVTDPVRISGPGADAVEAAVRAAPRQDAGNHFILAGLAGGLNPDICSGNGFWISRVLNEHGAVVNSEEPLNPENGPFASIHMSSEPIFGPAEKALLYESSTADLVDMEAWRFAEVCSELGIRWSIIRGVSDAAMEQLPTGSDKLVDAQGAARPLKITIYILSHPWRIPSLMSLSRRTDKALRNVAEELKKSNWAMRP